MKSNSTNIAAFSKELRTHPDWQRTLLQDAQRGSEKDLVRDFVKVAHQHNYNDVKTKDVMAIIENVKKSTGYRELGSSELAMIAAGGGLDPASFGRGTA